MYLEIPCRFLLPFSSSNIPPYKGPALSPEVNIELGNAPEWQLYNVNDDIGQQKNLANENGEKLQEMIKSFKEIRGNAYSCESNQLILSK